MPRGKKAIWLAVALALILSLVGWGRRRGRASAVVTPLTITTTSLPDGGVGAPYSQTLHASGGTGSYTGQESPAGGLLGYR